MGDDCEETEFYYVGDAIDQLQTSIFVNSVRFATHTLQLAVYDVIKNESSKLKQVRELVKQFKKNPYRNAFSAQKRRKPFLDVPTRWNSCYEMVNCLFSQKQFIVDLISDNIEINITVRIY